MLDPYRIKKEEALRHHSFGQLFRRSLVGVMVLISLIYPGAGAAGAGNQSISANRWNSVLIPHLDQSAVVRPSGAGGQPIDPLLVAAAPDGVPVLVDFENLAVGDPLYNQYPSLVFLGGNATNFDGSPTIKVIQPSVTTASPSHALASQFQTTCEFGCGAHMSMAFGVAQQRVSLSTGLPSMAAGTSGMTMELAGFIANPGTGALVGTPIVQSVAMNLCGSTGPTALTQPLEIDDPAGRINYAVLAVVSCTDLNNFESGLNGASLSLDNLLYNRALNPSAGDHTPPVITMITPTNGQSITGGTPGTFFLDVSAQVTEVDLARMTVQINSGSPVLMSFHHTSANTYIAGVMLTNLNGLVAGANSLTVQAWDFDIPQNTTSSSINFTYTVKPPPPPSSVDIWPTAYEVNQSIDMGPVPFASYAKTSLGYEVHVTNTILVQGKPALIRIYAGASGTTTPIEHVPAMMNIDKDNCLSNCQVTNGLPPVLDPVDPNLTGLKVAPLTTPEGTPAGAIADLYRTWNFLIQPQWTQQDLVVTIQLNSGGYPGLAHVPSVPECSAVLAGTCDFNNQIKLHLHFVAPPQITVVPVVIHVTGSYHGRTFNDIQPSAAQVDKIFSQLNELYPAAVTRGATENITIAPGLGKDDLMGMIEDFYGGNLCLHGSPGSKFFIGILPADQAAHDLGANESGPNGFVAGYASIGVPFCGNPGAWADADNPIDTAHELGHNIGFDHWACENGVNNDECGVFPIPHGGIGGVGIDLASWSLIPPGNNSTNASPHAHDFMTYGQMCSSPQFSGVSGCDTGEWVSWYTYNILLEHATIDSYDTLDAVNPALGNATTTPALRMRGFISPAGVATFQPVYQVNLTAPVQDNIVEDDPGAIYTLQGFDANGNTLFVHNFEPAKLNVHDANYGKALTFDQAVPAIAGIVKVQALHGRQVLGAITNGAPGKGPSVSITAPAAGATWAVNSHPVISWNPSSPAGLPLTAMVEYSPDGGLSRYPLGKQIVAHSLTVDADQLAGSTNAWVYVQVSDGMNTATAQVGPFTVAAKSPVVHIISPGNNSSMTEHLSVTLEGTAFDRQESLQDNQFVWSSNRDGVLGTGKRLTLNAGLTPGLHTLTLTVIDSQARKSQDQVVIYVHQPFQLFLPSVR